MLVKIGKMFVEQFELIIEGADLYKILSILDEHCVGNVTFGHCKHKSMQDGWFLMFEARPYRFKEITKALTKANIDYIDVVIKR